MNIKLRYFLTAYIFAFFIPCYAGFFTFAWIKEADIFEAKFTWTLGITLNYQDINYPVTFGYMSFNMQEKSDDISQVLISEDSLSILPSTGIFMLSAQDILSRTDFKKTELVAELNKDDFKKFIKNVQPSVYTVKDGTTHKEVVVSSEQAIKDAVYSALKALICTKFPGVTIVENKRSFWGTIWQKDPYQVLGESTQNKLPQQQPIPPRSFLQKIWDWRYRILTVFGISGLLYYKYRKNQKYHLQ